MKLEFKRLKKWVTPVLAGCLISILLSTAARSQTIIVPPFRVDNAPAGIYAFQPAVQRSLNGDEFFVVWGDSDGLSYEHLIGSIYDSDGNIIRDDYRIDDGGVGFITQDTGPGGITVDSNGNYYLAFTWSDNFVTFYGRIRKFLPNGDPAGQSVNIKDSGSLGSQVIQVASGFNNRIIVTYGDGPSPGYIYYRFFDNNLIPQASPVVVNQGVIGSLAGLATDFNGNFVEAYRQSDSPGDGMMRARLYDPNGNPRTDEFAIESVMSGGSHPVASYNKYGNFVVSWYISYGGRYRVFDGDGNPLTTVRSLGPGGGEPNDVFGYPAVDSDDAGNFVIVYDYYSDLTPWGLYGTILDPNGAVLRQFFPISINSMDGWQSQDVAYLSEGRFVAAFTNSSFDVNGDIYAVIFGNDHWVAPPPTIPAAGPLALAILALGLGWMLRRRIIA